VILQTVRFFAVILTALTLVPAGAHLFELPNKISLSREQYFTVQGNISWLGIVRLRPLRSHRRQSCARDPCSGRAPCLLARAYGLPPNGRLVRDLHYLDLPRKPKRRLIGTVVPTNWANLRTQWEYSHAANAVMTFLALCVVTASLLVTKR
jgi:hypothetical protein